MANLIHICFSQSAMGSLKYAVTKNKITNKERVIGLFDNISQGDISDLKNIEKRIVWRNMLIGEEDNCEDIDILKQNYENFYKEISEISEEDTVYLWYSQSSDEMCGMMYTLKLLNNRISNVFLINVSDRITKYNEEIYIPRSVSEIDPLKLLDYLKVKKRLENKQYEDLLEQWETLQKQNSILRVFTDGRIMSVTKEYYDIDILKYTEKTLKRAARIVGNVLGHSENIISDDYIFWRIKELVKSGELRYKGKFGVMREMEICITDKGISHLSNDAKALEFFEKREAELEFDRQRLNDAKNQGALQEKMRIAKKLLDVLDVKTISEKVGLTEEQIRNM